MYVVLTHLNVIRIDSTPSLLNLNLIQLYESHWTRARERSSSTLGNREHPKVKLLRKIRSKSDASFPSSQSVHPPNRETCLEMSFGTEGMRHR